MFTFLLFEILPQQIVNCIRYSRKPLTQIRPYSKHALVADNILRKASKYTATAAGGYTLIRCQNWYPVFYSFAFITSRLILTSFNTISSRINPNWKWDIGVFIPHIGSSAFISSMLITHIFKTTSNAMLTPFQLRIAAVIASLYTATLSFIRVYSKRLTLVDASIGVASGVILGYSSTLLESPIITALSKAPNTTLKAVQLFMLFSCILALQWKRVVLLLKSRYVIASDSG
jgi:hypothetical protein